MIPVLRYRYAISCPVSICHRTTIGNTGEGKCWCWRVQIRCQLERNINHSRDACNYKIMVEAGLPTKFKRYPTIRSTPMKSTSTWSTPTRSTSHEANLIKYTRIQISILLKCALKKNVARVQFGVYLLLSNQLGHTDIFQKCAYLPL